MERLGKLTDRAVEGADRLPFQVASRVRDCDVPATTGLASVM